MDTELEVKKTRVKTEWVTIGMRFDKNSVEYKQIEALADKNQAGVATVCKAMVKQWLKKLGAL